jgi:hypothetical protein
MWAGLDELSHQILMMGIELVPETSIFNQLTQLIAQEDFINVLLRHYSLFALHGSIIHY